MFGWQLRPGAHGGKAPFSPLALFKAGEQGVWCDPGDLSTMFQDSAGTTPVTGPGQPVGLQLDKSKGLARGAELQVNGDFNSASGWALDIGWTVAGGKAIATSVPAGRNISPTNAVVTVAGRWYEAYVVVSAITSGQARLLAFNGVGNIGSSAVITAPGIYYMRFAATNATTRVYLTALSAPMSGEFELVSFRELPGNHASQIDAAKRPILRDSPRRVDYDTVDDALVTTFSTALGSACTVARSIPGVGAQILTAQNIGTSFTDNVDNCGLVIVNRALTPAETAGLTRYLNQRAGV